MPSKTPSVRFETIDLDRHEDLCVAFVDETFRASFGDPDRFRREFGPNGEVYRVWLRDAVRDHPGGHVHAWIGEVIVGQIAMRPLSETPDIGYVHLVYVAPDWRATGVGDRLDAYTSAWLREQGCRRARLSVSETNERAIRFYRRCGWTDVGPRPGKPGERVLERAL